MTKDKLCSNWYEDDGERCKGKQHKCTCSGVYSQCNYPDYFTQATGSITIGNPITKGESVNEQ